LSDEQLWGHSAELYQRELWEQREELYHLMVWGLVVEVWHLEELLEHSVALLLLVGLLAAL
jgi:hypothetical protein